MTALAQTERAEARERIVKAAVEWVFDQSCSNALIELEDAVEAMMGEATDHPFTAPLRRQGERA